MTQFLKHQLHDLLNRPGPLWLVKANLEKTNFKGADLRNTILFHAKLIGAIMPDGTVHE